MDTLNDHYPIYPPNPNACSDTDESENEVYVQKLQSINNNRRRKREYCFDDWCAIYSDDLWYLWCTIKDFRYNINDNLFDRLTYPLFCDICYQNSTRR